MQPPSPLPPLKLVGVGGTNTITMQAETTNSRKRVPEPNQAVWRQQKAGTHAAARWCPALRCHNASLPRPHGLHTPRARTVRSIDRNWTTQNSKETGPGNPPRRFIRSRPGWADCPLWAGFRTSVQDGQPKARLFCNSFRFCLPCDLAGCDREAAVGAERHGMHLIVRDHAWIPG